MSAFISLSAGLFQSHPFWQAFLSSFSLQNSEALVQIRNLKAQMKTLTAWEAMTTVARSTQWSCAFTGPLASFFFLKVLSSSWNKKCTKCMEKLTWECEFANVYLSLPSFSVIHFHLLVPKEEQESCKIEPPNLFGEQQRRASYGFVSFASFDRSGDSNIQLGLSECTRWTVRANRDRLGYRKTKNSRRHMIYTRNLCVDK